MGGFKRTLGGMIRLTNRILWPACAIAAVVATAAGCGHAGSDKPKQAASSLEQAFGKADAEAKNTAAMASEALRTADYEKAVVSLEVIRARRDLSLQQGMAVQEAEVALTARLIAAMDAGDPKAKQAYELLKRSKRD